MKGGETVRRSSGPSLLLLPLLLSAASAQVASNRATRYLYPTDVTDARALWVNPGGLGRIKEASIHLDVTVGEPGPGGRLRQLTAGFNSRGFSLGYQRDLFDGGVRGHTYRLGFAGGARRLAAGGAATLYRGASSSKGWDVGVVYDLAPALTIGGVIANIGRPIVRDSTQPVTYTAGATLRLPGAGGLGGVGGVVGMAGVSGAISADVRIMSDGVAGYAFGARMGLRERTAWPLRLLLRVDTDRTLRRAGFALGLSVGADDLIGAVATAPGDLRRVDALSLYGVSTRRLTR